jgi:putative transposase
MAETAQTLSFKRGRLPHWLVAGRAYFVTLCRKGCLPEKVVAELRAERAERAAALRASGDVCPYSPDRAHRAMPVRADVLGRPTSERLTAGGPARPAVPCTSVPCTSVPAAEALAAQRRRFLQLDAILDAAGHGERDLCESEVSRIILGNLDWLRGCGWRVWAATLMPSHAHLVLSNTEGRGAELTGDLARFMAYTARLVNRDRGCSGGFWQREPFDHWCRDGDAWLRSVSYTLNNPVKAGLCRAWREWPHSVVDPDAEGLMP